MEKKWRRIRDITLRIFLSTNYCKSTSTHRSTQVIDYESLRYQSEEMGKKGGRDREEKGI